MIARMTRRIALTLAFALLVPAGTLAAGPAPATTAGTDGAALVTPFYEILLLPEGTEKAAALAAYLAPEFQVLRTTGVRLDAAAYAATPPAVTAYALGETTATTDPSGSVAIVSYVVTTDSTIDGVTQTTTAPRLAAFRRTDDGWRMAALANLTAFPAAGAPSASPIDGVPAASAAPAAPAAPLTDDRLTGLAAYYDALMLADGPAKTEALRAILAPEFQVLRTNGRQLDVAAFLAEPALIHAWEIRDPAITDDPDGTLRIVTFTARTDSTIEGLTQTTVAPRLAVLRNDAGRWVVAALANLTPLPAPAPSPAG